MIRSVEKKDSGALESEDDMTLDDLRELSRLNEELDSIKSQIDTMEARLMAARPPKLDGMPKSFTTGDGSDMLVSYIALKDKYQKLYQSYAGRIDAAEDKILTSGLSSVQRQAIRYRYIQGLTVQETADKLSYTERQTHRILRDAESKLCH